MFIGKTLVQLSILLIAFVDGLAPGEGLAAISTPDRATIIHHALTVELIPDKTEMPTGFLGLQVHGIGKGTGPYSVRWREIYLRELK